jgi:predicted nucleotidyltransferase
LRDVNTVVDSALVDDVVRLIVDAVKPVRIILFGSAARGQMNENSDLDLLIIMPDGTHRRNTARLAYRALAGLGVPKDVIVVTEEDVLKYGDEPSLVICPALQEGKEIYRAS